MKRRILILLLVPGILGGVTHHSSRPDDAAQRRVERTNYLRRLVDEPFRSSQEIQKLRWENPEWQLFTYSFTTFAMAALIQADGDLAPVLAPSMKHAVINCLGKPMQRVFGLAGHDVDEVAGRMALYFGHLNLMLGLYQQATGDDGFEAENTAITRALHRAIMLSPTRNVASYPGQIWPADNSVVMASLAVYDRTHGTDYAEAARAWTAWIRDHFLDENGLMHSEVHPVTHEPIDGPRGCSIAWTIQFASYFDPRFAAEQYTALKQHMAGGLAGVGLFRERPGDRTTGPGDIDSGPLFLGYGVAASGLAYGAAVATGDGPTARRLREVIEVFGCDTRSGDERHYRVFSPLSDALVLFAETVGSPSKR